jgi:hypothetical protein
LHFAGILRSWSPPIYSLAQKAQKAQKTQESPGSAAKLILDILNKIV